MTKKATEAKKSSKAEGQAEGTQFSIQRIYTKDVSFEAPNSPEMFRSDWKPALNLDLNTHTSLLSDDHHEVVLRLTVTVKVEDKVAFLAEVNQAGIFQVQSFPKDQLAHLLGSFCPNLLFPYAREVISSLVGRGGFPQLYLAPINFDALFEQQQEAAKGGKTD